MHIIQRGAFCNIDDPLDPEELDVFTLIMRAGDAGHQFVGRVTPSIPVALYNLFTRGWIEQAHEKQNNWTYRATYLGRQRWLRLQKDV